MIEDDAKRWFVYLPNGTPEDVGAESLHIVDGDLVFYNGGGIILFAYAKGNWKFVEFQE